MKRLLFLILILIAGAGLVRSFAYAGSHDTPAVAGARSIAFLHGDMNIRGGPGTNHRVVGRAQQGQMLRLGDRDPEGWAQVYGQSGRVRGYIWTPSRLLEREPYASEWAELSTLEAELMSNLILRCRENQQELRLLIQRSQQSARTMGIRTNRAALMQALAGESTFIHSGADCSARADFILLTHR